MSWGSWGTDPNSWAEDSRSDAVGEPFSTAWRSPCRLTATVPAGGRGGMIHTINPSFRSAPTRVVSFAVSLASVPVLRPVLCLSGTVTDAAWQNSLHALIYHMRNGRLIWWDSLTRWKQHFLMSSLTHKATFPFIQSSQDLQFSRVDTLWYLAPNPCHRIF